VTSAVSVRRSIGMIRVQRAVNSSGTSSNFGCVDFQ
jgi:hypothetical protein